MALSPKENVLVNRYARRQPSVLNDDVRQYLVEELREIEAALRSLTDGVIQVSDREPSDPLKGMVRYAVSPWDPLGDGTEGLVVYNGNSWAAV